MRHEAIIDLLPDLVGDRLGGAVREMLEQHLASCEECRSIARSCRVLDSVVRNGAPADAHPSSEEIVSFALSESRLDEDDLLAINAHVKHCSECLREVEAVRAAEGSDTGRERRLSLRALLSEFRWQGALVPAAAAIVVALLAYPAYLGIVRLPQVAAEVSTARSEAERLIAAAESAEASERAGLDELAALRSWSGAAPLHLITGRQRSSSSRDVVDATTPVIAFGVDLPIPDELEDGELLRFEILDSAGRCAASAGITAGDARGQVRKSGVVTFLVSSALLERGVHEVRVISAPPGTPAGASVERRQLLIAGEVMVSR